MSVRTAIFAAGIVQATPLLAAADPLNIKPGAWEITTTAVASGIRLPAEALARLSPEQRAKMEASMREQDGKPVTQVNQSCVTKEDLEQNTLLASDEDCARKIVSSSATKIVIDETCAAPNASSSRMTIEAPAPNRILMTMDRTQAGGARSGLISRAVGSPPVAPASTTTSDPGPVDGRSNRHSCKGTACTGEP